MRTILLGLAVAAAVTLGGIGGRTAPAEAARPPADQMLGWVSPPTVSPLLLEVQYRGEYRERRYDRRREEWRRREYERRRREEWRRRNRYR